MAINPSEETMDALRTAFQAFVAETGVDAVTLRCAGEYCVTVQPVNPRTEYHVTDLPATLPPHCGDTLKVVEKTNAV
jgi:hypothetical protein